MDGQSGANENSAKNAQDKNESSKRYITGGRKRSENNSSRNYSAQNNAAVPQFFAAAMANDAPARAENSKRIWPKLGIIATIVVLLAIIVIAVANIFNRSVGSTMSKEDYQGMVYFRDEMNCEVSYRSFEEEKKFSIVADDGWKNAIIKGVTINDVVVDLTIYNGDVYLWRYDDYNKSDRKMNHRDSLIYTFEDFEKYQNYNIRSRLRSLGSSDPNMAIRCKTLDSSVFRAPDEKLFNDQRPIVKDKND